MKVMELIMEDIKKNKNIDYEQLKINLERIAPTQKHFDNLLELLDFVYYLGVEDGDDGGYQEALKEGGVSDRDEEQIYEEAYDNARNDMQEDIDNSYYRGQEEGYDDGYENGKQEGYDEGYENGRQKGYDEGYDKGLEDAER